MKKLLCVILAILFIFPLTGCQKETKDSLLDASDIPPTLEEEMRLISAWSLLCDSSQFVIDDFRWISGLILYNDGDWMLLQVDPQTGYGEYVWVKQDGIVKKNQSLKVEKDGTFYTYGYATFSFTELRRPIKPGYPVRVMDGDRLWDY